MKVLISSLSAKISMVQAVRTGFSKLDSATRIVGADANPHCGARDYVDDFIVMPELNTVEIGAFIEELSARHISHIIPSRDGELPFYAEHMQLFNNAGIQVMVSSLETLLVCLDKYQFFEKNQHRFPVINTSLMTTDKEQHWVVKERYGSGSAGVLLNVPTNVANTAAKELQQPVVQPYIPGNEYSIDLYLSQDNRCRGYVVRSRDEVRNGESKTTTSVRRPDIGDLAKAIALANGLVGHCLVQIIEDDYGKLHIIEINPRFGGASALSVLLGLDSFYWFALETTGQGLGNSGIQDYEPDVTFNKMTYERELIRHES